MRTRQSFLILNLSVIGKTCGVYPTLDLTITPPSHEIDHHSPAEPNDPGLGTFNLQLLVKTSDYKSDKLHR